ncbi:hypothetical protein [Arachidicoccus soli]|uniref:Uncharacterized protein n=1 Tax=Arachidicoccus soli TaxID=2341117 RepID=A0A386HSR8_9BACT|nr:hypothetical protein [Arachidicoccus soli]AYD48546.1 hypothetical protein D6B99_13620 [Arachidicoccus soli]
MLNKEINTAHPLDGVKPSKKKIIYSIKRDLRTYLKRYGREVPLPINYDDLMHFTYARPLIDKDGNETAWEQVSYDMREWEFLKDGLVKCYAMLKTEGDFSFSDNLNVERIDFCSFGNSQPFRIRIVNNFNGNNDHFYIKKADANRVYGLELEHLLSSARVTFLTSNQTLVEEHIAGIPGDIFIRDYLHKPETNLVRLLKTFVKFNEACYARLLGDMRAYNFVVNITPDIEGTQYSIRAIDFDQQTYEGRMRLYLPQFAKENFPMVQDVLKLLDTESIKQYQAEERSRLVYRIATERYRMKELMDVMLVDEISTPEKVEQLKFELAEHWQNVSFLKAKTMGRILKIHMKQMLLPNLNMVLKVVQRKKFS